MTKQNLTILIVLIVATSIVLGYSIYLSQNNISVPSVINSTQNSQLTTSPKNNNFEKKSNCISLGEQYYTNYVEEQKHNDMFSFDVYDMGHEIAYSSSLDTCLLYVNIKFKDFGGRIGHNSNKFILDLLNNKYLYFMSYGADDKGNEIVLYHPEFKGPSSFATDEEFMSKKIEIFK
jgi:hypothetical protein